MIEPLLSDDALLADVDSPPADPDSLRLWWLGQSGYLLRYRHHRILLDPYLSDSLTAKYANTPKPHVRMHRRVVDPARLTGITLITSTHAHTDHLDPLTLAALREANAHALPAFVAPRAILPLAEQRWGGPIDFPLNASESCAPADDLTLYALPAAHDQLDLTPDGLHPYLGYLLHVGPYKLYHSGDTVTFPTLPPLLQPHRVDLALLPINGKVGNMNGHDAAQLAKAISARLVIPCHYDLFEFNTADPESQFIPTCREISQPFRVLKLGQQLTLSPNGESA